MPQELREHLTSKLVEGAWIGIVHDKDFTSNKPLQIKRAFQGQIIYLWVYITQAVKQLYLDGKLAVGDLVLVVFAEASTDNPIAIAKVLL